MKRLGMFMAATAAFTAIGCGGNGEVDPDTQFELVVTIVNEGDAVGSVQVVAMSNLIDDSCTAACTYGVDANHDAELRPVESASTVFVGWSGDCTGTGNVTKTAAAGEAVACTATFAPVGADGPPREGILAANRRTCTPTASPLGFDCNVFAGGSFNVNAPSPALDAALLTANPSCYYYVDVNEFTSEDHGQVTLETSLINATATWSGGYYNFTGLSGAPFSDIDLLTITTQGGEVEIDSPPGLTLVDDPTDGLQIETNGTADSVRLLAFGYTADDVSFGVLCRLPFAATAAISNPDFVDAIQLAGGGAFPDTVFAGFSNQEDITGWDDEPRVGEAVNWVQLDGGNLEAMGELQAR